MTREQRHTLERHLRSYEDGLTAYGRGAPPSLVAGTREICDALRAALSSAPPDLVALRADWERRYVAHHANPTPGSARELNAIEGRLLAWSPAPPVAPDSNTALEDISKAYQIILDGCDDPHGALDALERARSAIRRAASPVVAPAPVVEKAMQYAIALMRDRLDVEAPANAAVIREYIAALSPRETAPGGGR